MTARQCFKKKMAFSHTDPENPWTPTPPLHDHTNILQQILNLTPLEKFNFFFWKGGRGGGVWWFDPLLEFYLLKIFLKMELRGMTAPSRRWPSHAQIQKTPELLPQSGPGLATCFGVG
jgi:hypothetical protein